MRFGIVGLGKMGSNLARNALANGLTPVGYDRTRSLTEALVTEGVDPAWSLDELAQKLPAPRIILIYVPHGDPTEAVCRDLRSPLSSGDVVVDGGNSHWAESHRRSQFFAESGIHFLDVGTSGGISGARNGACFMVGGDRHAFEVVSPVLRKLAVDDEAVVYAGPSGSGHFVKLVHNAIEFGMVQAIAEGVELLARAEYDLDLPALLTNWNHGSVIRGWLIELMSRALSEEHDLGSLSTYVEDTGEVKWIVDWALARDIPTPVITTSQTALMQYRDLDSVAAKAVALLRHGFGGHPVHRGAAEGGATRR